VDHYPICVAIAGTLVILTSCGQRAINELQITSPPISAWIQIEESMSEREALAILGPPQSIEVVEGAFTAVGGLQSSIKLLQYGSVSYQSHQLRITYPFRLVIGGDRVLTKQDPYGGRLSISTIEYAPTLISPPSESLFTYYPSYVDLRWSLVSGPIDLEYELEVQYGGEAGMPPYSEHSKSIVPQYTFLLPRARNIRWRVRAVSKSVTGPWSEFYVMHGME
jgi:hypothetical protein